MRGLKKIVLTITQVFDLILGVHFATPVAVVTERYPYLPFDD